MSLTSMPMYSVAFFVKASPGRANPKVNGLVPLSSFWAGVQVASLTPVLDSVYWPKTSPSCALPTAKTIPVS